MKTNAEQINELVQKKIDKWYREAGGQSCMIDDLPEEAFNRVVDKFRAEAEQELNIMPIPKNESQMFKS